MLNKLLFALIFSLALNTNAQEEIITFKNDLKTSSSDIKEVIPIVNKKNDALSIFFIDSKKIYGYLFDSNFKNSQQLSQDFKGKQFDKLIGNSITENNDYRVYFSNEKYSKFSSVNFSFKQNTAIIKELELELKKEKFIESVNYKNTFNLLTLSDKEPILNIYVFDENANYKKHQINFTGVAFYDKKSKEVVLNELLEKITKIKENDLNSIDLSSELSKLYVNDKELIFSFDQNKDSTQIILIDLKTFEKQVRKLSKPLNDTVSKQKKSNSYINDQRLFTIAASKNQFTFACQDLTTGVLINKYAFTGDKNDSISFKNSSIVQMGTIYKNYRELDQTKKFLQKINYGNVGISLFKMGDNYQIFLGGQHEYKATSGGMGMIRTPEGVQLSGGTLGAKHFNPVLNAFNLYSNTKTTYIKSLFNSNFEHINVDMQSNAFDKIKNFEENKLKSKNLKTVFKYKDYYILGNYLLETNQYRLRQFKN